MTGKHRKVHRALNYFDHFLVYVSSVSSSISTSVFPTLAGVPIGVASSPVGWNIGAIIVRIKTDKSIINKKENDISVTS